MSRAVRFDTHAHLYDCYSSKIWCESALRNLGADCGSKAVVCVVDREGQDSLARLRIEVPQFGEWREIWDGDGGEIVLSHGSVTVVRGVQYVSSERIEVLGLAVGRSLSDKLPVSEYIEIINQEDGIPCLPWSPGKWFGKRGRVIRELLARYSPREVTVGDIAIRSRFGPPSLILRDAQRRGFSILAGSDPLPRLDDQALVGAYGIEVLVEEDSIGALSLSSLKSSLRMGSRITVWGRRNNPVQAIRRFVESLV